MLKARPNITVTCDVGDEHADFLEQRLRDAWTLAGPSPATVSLAVVDAQTMTRLHEQYLGEPGPTDVLTFELEHDAAGRVTEGEIVVCLAVAVEQAALRGHPVGHELLLYAIHGLLHLSGHDDRDPAGYARMHATEDEILRALGFGDVFSREELREPLREELHE